MKIKIIYIENDDSLGFESFQKFNEFIKENTHDKFLALSLEYSSVKFVTKELPDDFDKNNMSIFCKKIIFNELYEVRTDLPYRDYHQYWIFFNNNQEWEFIGSDWCLATDGW